MPLPPSPPLQLLLVISLMPLTLLSVYELIRRSLGQATLAVTMSLSPSCSWSVCAWA